MNKYIVIVMACLVVVQVEIGALLYLEYLNQEVWKSQIGLNDSIIEVVDTRCLTPKD